MSDVGLDLDSDDRKRRGRRRRRGPLGCLVGLVLLALVCAGAYVGVSKAVDVANGWLGPPEDYHGNGTGKVKVRVHDGASVSAIGQTLEDRDVVASVDAFVAVASGDKRARSIQPGTYRLREKMSARSAFRWLLDRDNLVSTTLTVPEGARVDDVVDLIAKNTDISRKAVVAALKKPGRIGLPKAAGKNPEGYLFPATYQVEPGTNAVDLLRTMVDKTKRVEHDMNLRKRARDLGISPQEAMTVASIIEYEAQRRQDLPKVARVIYNRLDKHMALQMDSTVDYITKREGDPWTTKRERNLKSAYNTYKHSGLPPGPIGSPGRRTLRAALDPAKGDWLYFVTVNFETGETKFAKTYKQHRKNVRESKRYCRKSELC